MKRIIATFILIFMLSAVLVGCVNPPENGGNGGELEGIPTPEGGESSTDNGESSGDSGDSKPSSPENGGENGGDVDASPENGGENGENSGDDPIGAPENGENSGENPTDTPTNPENPEENPTDTPTNPENPEENPTDTPTNPETPEQTDPPAAVVGNKVGNLMQSVTLERVDGGTVSTTGHEGKILILNIWATWCPPCKAELPDFNRIASEYADDVVIIAAHDVYGKTNAPAYVEQNFANSKIIFAYDNTSYEAFMAAGGGEYIPRTAIVDRNGVIVYSNYGVLSYEQLVKIIESL